MKGEGNVKLASRLQTSIRMVSKKFRLLYPIEDALNEYIARYVEKEDNIMTLQIFFDTDITSDDYINLLDLKGGILQVETSLDWNTFSLLEFKQQQIKFIGKLHNVVRLVTEVYGINENGYEISFQKIMKDLQ